MSISAILISLFLLFSTFGNLDIQISGLPISTDVLPDVLRRNGVTEKEIKSIINDIASAPTRNNSIPHVQVFHYIIHYWGSLYSGDQKCPNMICEFFHDHKLDMLSYQVRHNEEKARESSISNIKTASLYNIHYLHQSTRRNSPDLCSIKTNFTIAESEESYVRFGFLFNASFPNFDGRYSLVLILY